MALIDKLTAIADAVREKTGGTNTLTLEQIVTEIEGIEAEGGGLNYDMGEFVLDADGGTSVAIHHELGDIPELIVVWTDDFNDITVDNKYYFPKTTSLGYIWMNGLTGLPQRLTSTAVSKYKGIYIGIVLYSGDYRVNATCMNSGAYGMDYANGANMPTAENIYLAANGNVNVVYRAGIKYKYFVSKAFWNVGGINNAE